MTVNRLSGVPFRDIRPREAAHCRTRRRRGHSTKRNDEGAEREYRRALDLNPGDTQARIPYSTLLIMVSRVEEAVLRLGPTRFCLQPLQFFPRTELQLRHFSGAEVAHPDLSSAIHRDRL
jgi:hypothetical protein